MCEIRPRFSTLVASDALWFKTEQQVGNLKHQKVQNLASMWHDDQPTVWISLPDHLRDSSC